MCGQQCGSVDCMSVSNFVLLLRVHVMTQAPDIDIYIPHDHNSRTISLILSHVSASFSRAVRVIEECSPTAALAAFDNARMFRLNVTVTSCVIRRFQRIPIPLTDEQTFRRVFRIHLCGFEYYRLGRDIEWLDRFHRVTR
jgi:hypothetical protein